MCQATLPLLSLLLPGCGLLGPGLTGEWEGEVECDPDLRIEVVLDLESDGGGLFAGDMDLVSTRTRTVAGALEELVLTVACDAELERQAATGEQDLDYDIEVQDYDCELYQDGALTGWGCAELGVAVDEEESDFGRLTWDGKDEIDVDDGRCQGELER